ncbi:MAG: hypothetical protein JWM36_2732 [Hyphomicrobiales bacterium]|nr:hypothetical protein [Hyphomicrobiales bacterium]
MHRSQTCCTLALACMMVLSLTRRLSAVGSAARAVRTGPKTLVPRR